MKASDRESTCPQCGNRFLTERSIWFYASNLYCSEWCCRAAAGALR